ncbi:MAG: lipopolysaccharide heptosyltransferase II [Proteobacteria bacterium]|nr:lipopolysaccharide heptosyltransferase II [Pseudomonadota bacterium]MBU1138937.1 lipopolysaccharide heptosyltransferase II [Pseudomonadota bacterium]MBU1232239.1 lipopolysaccharide heptosyltransferase II [Pseudomonadota bacterium]MBU1417074.1 lipopolysaccharide heptosyltransferase II [Pseudomonadota bacterium]MBU1453770.1 lipopolysaccharide heptosyltransferase II [Pseudomonadota bacterium]
MSAQTSLKELNPRKILIRSTNWIGDAVMTTPAVHTIRENFPKAEITMLAVPWVADIFRLSPDVDKVLVYDKKHLYQGKIKGPLNLARDLKPLGFDAAILLQNAFEAAFLAKMAGIPVRAGYKRDGRGILLTHGVKISDAIRKKHQVHYYQNMLAGLGLTLGPDHLRLPLPEELEGWAKGFVDCLRHQNPVSRHDQQSVNKPSGPTELKSLNSEGVAVPVIGFNPGAAFGPAKRWPTEKFGQLAALIAHHYGESGCVIMIFGTEADTEAAREIRQFAVRTPHHVFDMTGKTSLKQAMALIKSCDVFVSNDSGLMHVAAGLGTPTIAIFGSTNHITTGPYSKNSIILRREMTCSPCLQTHCPQGHLNCLESIKATDVYEEVARMLSSNLLPDA